jgi:hypothetical protein
VATRQPVDDLYGELGVDPSATPDAISAAFRARARELHPDANSGDPVAEQRFKRLSAAYGVLSDPARRARYDAVVPTRTPPANETAHREPVPAPAPAPTGRIHLSRRGARWALGGGIVLVILGIVATAWVVSLQRHDADLRARGVAATATVVDVGGEHRLEFTTRDGQQVRAIETTKSGEQQPGLGARVKIHYDRDDPTTIVTDASHTGRDITLWIVAIKLVVGGAVLAFFGARRLRRLRSGLPS